VTEEDERNLNVARRLYEGEQSERASIARSIEWHVPGHNPVSGDYHGFIEYTELMPSRMAPLTRWDFTLEELMVNGNYVMTTFRLVGERKGIQIDTRGGHLLRCDKEGHVVEGWGFVADQDGLDRFFAS
jgi:hypothetical protein